MSTIKLLVLDKNDEFLVALEQYAHNVPELEIIGGATDVESLVERFDHNTPDLIFCDSSMLAALDQDEIARLRGQWPGVIFYRLTVFDESVYDEFAAGDDYIGSIARSGIEQHLGRVLDEVRELRTLNDVADPDSELD